MTTQQKLTALEKLVSLQDETMRGMWGESVDALQDLTKRWAAAWKDARDTLSDTELRRLAAIESSVQAGERLTDAEIDPVIEQHLPTYWQYGAVEQDRLRALFRAIESEVLRRVQGGQQTGEHHEVNHQTLGPDSKELAAPTDAAEKDDQAQAVLQAEAQANPAAPDPRSPAPSMGYETLGHAARPGVPVLTTPPQPSAPDGYKQWYDEAMAASNEAGFAGVDAAETIRALAAELQAARATQPAADGPLTDEQRLAWCLWRIKDLEQQLAKRPAYTQPAAEAVAPMPIAPPFCPITGRKFWGNIDHPEHGLVAVYGGPFDSYTIPAIGDDGELRCERYDQDAGEWVEGGEPAGWAYNDQREPATQPAASVPPGWKDELIAVVNDIAMHAKEYGYANDGGVMQQEAVKKENDAWERFDDLLNAAPSAAPVVPPGYKLAMQKIEAAMKAHPNAVPHLIGEAWDALNEAINAAPSAAPVVPPGCVIVSAAVLRKLGIADDVIDTITRPVENAASVPPGYKLVPVEPTPEMIAAWGNFRHGSGHAADIYRAMLNAAPSAGSAGLTDEQKLDLATNWFAEDWAIKKALGMLDDYERAHGIASPPEVAKGGGQ